MGFNPFEGRKAVGFGLVAFFHWLSGNETHWLAVASQADDYVPEAPAPTPVKAIPGTRPIAVVKLPDSFGELVDRLPDPGPGFLAAPEQGFREVLQEVAASVETEERLVERLERAREAGIHVVLMPGEVEALLNALNSSRHTIWTP